MAKYLTLASLERELRHTLTSSTTVRTAVLKSCAEVSMTSQPHAIRVDTFHVGLLPACVHECLHLAHNDALEYWGDLEEAMTEAAESMIVRYINRSPRRLAMWRKAISEVIDGQDD